MGKCHVLQDDAAELQLECKHFDPEYWKDKPGYQPVEGGRGGSIKCCIGDSDAILRLYYRGGMIRKFLSDQYFWLGKMRTRPWQEWRILNRARSAGLPVPEAIAVCAIKSGLWYRAAILTRYLENTETLASRLKSAVLESKNWLQLGVLIKRMHAEGIRHADLNASNILIDKQNQFFLIDFDKARIMQRIDDWQWQPLYRLQRSLDKFDRKQAINFRADDWQSLMDGYQL